MDVIARDYFRSLNPLARRILDQADSTLLTSNSSDSEANQTADSHVNRSTPTADDSFPYRRIAFGTKIFEDADKNVWRDEHSAPFSWETQSQLDISIRLDSKGTLPVRFQSDLNLDSATIPLSEMLKDSKLGIVNFSLKVLSFWTTGEPFHAT